MFTIQTNMIRSYGPGNPATFAYGSLLSDSVEKRAPHIIARFLVSILGRSNTRAE